jgi:hypothetical protein
MLQEGNRFLDPRAIPGSSGTSQERVQHITGLPDVMDLTSSEYPELALVHGVNTLDSGPSTVMTKMQLSRSEEEAPETISPEILSHDYAVMSNLQKLCR